MSAAELYLVWETVQFGLSAVLVIAGLFFVFAGAIGVLRLPDFYTRLHAAGVTDTLGAELVLLGLAVQAGLSLLTAKLFLVGLVLVLTSPAATHAIAHAAHTAGLKPLLGRFKANHPADGPA
jgi:multicomponent Na+:H+ antiporter subunit G